MSEAAAVGRAVGWLIDLYMVIGLMLVVVLVPQVEKALNEYWFSTENGVWSRVIASIVLASVLMQSCA